ncbi:MAG: hypothetical protein WBW48_11790 [Anaerolineae bacterium]
MSIPLTVQVTEEEGEVTLYCPELDLVTCSSTLGKARENFADLEPILKLWFSRLPTGILG